MFAISLGHIRPYLPISSLIGLLSGIDVLFDVVVCVLWLCDGLSGDMIALFCSKCLNIFFSWVCDIVGEGGGMF